MNIEKVRPHIEILQYVKARKAELDEMERNSKAAVQEALGDNEVGELDGRIAVTWKHIKTRKLNQHWLKERYPEARENCMDTTEQRRFVLE